MKAASAPHQKTDRRLALAGAGLLCLAYIVVFALTRPYGLAETLRRTAMSVVPALLLSVPTHLVLQSFIWPARPRLQLAAQVPLAVLFTLLWYVLILVAYSIGEIIRTGGLEAAPFIYVAFVWQMFQGITLYAVIALFSQVIHLRQRLAEAETALNSPRSNTQRPLKALMVRTDREMVSIDPSEILRISGAGDYSELVLRDRTLLSTTPLADFEDELGANGFVRAHRSHLVRLGAIEKAEPAGNGRLLLLLSNGDTVVASRSGARLIRNAAR